MLDALIDRFVELIKDCHEQYHGIPEPVRFVLTEMFDTKVEFRIEILIRLVKVCPEALQYFHFRRMTLQDGAASIPDDHTAEDKDEDDEDLAIPEGPPSVDPKNKPAQPIKPRDPPVPPREFTDDHDPMFQ